MTSDQLERAHLAPLLESVERHYLFLYRFKARMEMRHFPLSDPMYRRVVLAREAVEGLRDELKDRVARSN